MLLLYGWCMIPYTAFLSNECMQRILYYVKTTQLIIKQLMLNDGYEVYSFPTNGLAKIPIG